MQGRGCEWFDRVYLKFPLDFFSSQTAPGIYCRLHITVTQGSSPKEPQPNRPLEPKPSVARLTRMTSLRTMSSSPTQRRYASTSFRCRSPRNLSRPVITHAQTSRSVHPDVEFILPTQCTCVCPCTLLFPPLYVCVCVCELSAARQPLVTQEHKSTIL